MNSNGAERKDKSLHQRPDVAIREIYNKLYIEPQTFYVRKGRNSEGGYTRCLVSK